MADQIDPFGVEPADHPSESALAAFLDGELATNERREVEAHLERCTSCRHALAETVDVLGTSVSDTPPVRAMVPARRRGRGPKLVIALAFAASVAAVAILRRSPQSTVDIEGRTRDAAPTALDERIPELAAIAPSSGAKGVVDHPTFTWRSAGTGRYSFGLFALDGTAVWSSEVADTTLVLPADVRLGRGQSYFWRVDALAAGIVATTHAQRFTVSP